MADLSIETDMFDFEVICTMAKASLQRFRSDYELLPSEIRPSFDNYVRFRLFGDY